MKEKKEEKKKTKLPFSVEYWMVPEDLEQFC